MKRSYHILPQIPNILPFFNYSATFRPIQEANQPILIAKPFLKKIQNNRRSLMYPYPILSVLPFGASESLTGWPELTRVDVIPFYFVVMP